MSTPNTFSTPPNRTRKRTHLVNSPSLSTSIDLIENDDLEEKMLRRKSKLLSNKILSPGGLQSSPKRSLDQERRKTLNLCQVGMTKDQLQDHYSTCLKLSAENKINAKNAFGLHLIDYMKDLLKQSQNENAGTNFLLASCTLDAGVKIYAYRVDCIHSEAYKILSSLGRATVDNEEDNEQNNDVAEEATQQTEKKKIRKKGSGKTIEKNIKSINCDRFELEFEKDPFFQKTVAAFDEGGTGGLLCLQLSSKSDNCDLMMDSSIRVNDIPLVTQAETTADDQMIDLTFLREMYTNIPIDKLEICPQFSSFRFNGWNRNSLNCSAVDDSFDDNVHKFDVNAPVISDLMDTSEIGGDYTMDNNDNDDGDDLNEMGALRGTTGDIESRSTLINITGSDKLTLSMQPSEYSYFNQDLLSLWAGPLHWKVKPKSKDRSTTTVSDTSKCSVKKKIPLRINFEEEVDFKKYFSSGRAATYLKDSTLEKYSSQFTVLPEDLHYTADNLFKLWLMPLLSLRKIVDTKVLQNDDQEPYDYNNKNDREGFCPALDDLGDGDYSDDDGVDNDMMVEDEHSPDKICMSDGFDLVAQPNKVRFIDINYAKAAKRIDIKKLKGTMWKMIKKDASSEKENNDKYNIPKPNIRQEEEVSGAEFFEGTYSFKDMYKALPSEVSSNMAKNLSTPIAFVCLLYLANEKNLKLTGTDNMDDIVIESGQTSNAKC
ncbi:condensin complex subunit 2 isoform X2 [Hydra vulgaris]|uniref:Condensin complex subunit 2 n=1 Tax=Hydra vulgaris TaxID=6087 RepID=A0ABM4BL75_HYDVU